ncbi:MAG: serine hydrolase [Christensenellales bacterium]
MKKAFSLLLIIALMLAMLPVFAHAAVAYEGEAMGKEGVVLMDLDTGKVLAQNGAHKRVYPASTTKILTCLVALENGELNDVVTCSANVLPFVDPHSSNIQLATGEKMTLRDLLYGLMLKSGNDAAIAIAEHIGGSVEGFADMMNARAQEIGMADSHFVNPHGFDDDDHYTTAYDMAILTREALSNGHFAVLFSKVEHTPAHTNVNAGRGTWVRTDRLMLQSKEEYYSKCTGGKTGNTQLAGSTYVAIASEDPSAGVRTQSGVNLIASIFNDATYDGTYRWDYAIEMFEFGFEHYGSEKLSDVLQQPPQVEVSVKNAAQDDDEQGRLILNCTFEDAEDTVLRGWKEDLAALKQDPSLLQIVPSYDGDVPSAPIHEGAEVGTASLQYNGEEVAQAKLSASRSVAQAQDTQPTMTTSSTTAPDEQPAASGWSKPIVIILLVLGALLLAATAFICISRIRLNGKRRKRRTTLHKNDSLLRPKKSDPASILSRTPEERSARKTRYSRWKPTNRK